MITKETFYAGSTKRTGTFTMTAGSKRVQVINADIDGTLPDARKLKNGGPCYYFVNISNYTVAVKYNSGSVLFELESYERAEVCLLDNSTSDGQWFWRKI